MEEFTLEKMKIHERLSAIEAKFDLYIPELQSNVTNLTKIITGNGNPEGGIAFRISKMEEQKVRRDREIGRVITGVCAVAVTLVTDLIHRTFFHR